MTEDDPDAVARRLLLIEDDDELAEMLAGLFVREGYTVDVAQDGQRGLHLGLTRRYGVMVIDRRLPAIEGLEVLIRLRQQGVTARALMLTALDSLGDRVDGLDAGADDYLVKPFAAQELQARLRALLRRSQIAAQPAGPGATTTDTAGPDRFTFADVRLDPATREVWRGERPLRLTRTEFAILEVFLRHPRQVLTRAVLFEQVWGYDFGETSNSIHVYLGYLRRKLEAEGEERLLHTVRGVGFVLREEPL